MSVTIYRLDLVICRVCLPSKCAEQSMLYRLSKRETRIIYLSLRRMNRRWPCTYLCTVLCTVHLPHYLLPYHSSLKSSPKRQRRRRRRRLPPELLYDLPDQRPLPERAGPWRRQIWGANDRRYVQARPEALVLPHPPVAGAADRIPPWAKLVL